MNSFIELKKQIIKAFKANVYSQYDADWDKTITFHRPDSDGIDLLDTLGLQLKLSVSQVGHINEDQEGPYKLWFKQQTARLLAREVDDRIISRVIDLINRGYGDSMPELYKLAEDYSKNNKYL